MLEQIAKNEADVASFASGYFRRLTEILNGISTDDISRFAAELSRARDENRTVFIVGNGGSATTATSMANDLGFDILKKSGTKLPFRLMALTDSNAVLTAVANDVGYENVFVNQLRIHYRPGDALIVISASGNSPNVVQAAEFVREAGGRVLGLLGFSGGALKSMCAVSVHVPSVAGEYGPVEDAHLIINHVLAHWFQVRLRS